MAFDTWTWPGSWRTSQTAALRTGNWQFGSPENSPFHDYACSDQSVCCVHGEKWLDLTPISTTAVTDVCSISECCTLLTRFNNSVLVEIFIYEPYVKIFAVCLMCAFNEGHCNCAVSMSSLLYFSWCYFLLLITAYLLLWVLKYPLWLIVKALGKSVFKFCCHPVFSSLCRSQLCKLPRLS